MTSTNLIQCFQTTSMEESIKGNLLIRKMILMRVVLKIQGPIIIEIQKHTRCLRDSTCKLLIVSECFYSPHKLTLGRKFSNQITHQKNSFSQRLEADHLIVFKNTTRITCRVLVKVIKLGYSEAWLAKDRALLSFEPRIWISMLTLIIITPQTTIFNILLNSILMVVLLKKHHSFLDRVRRTINHQWHPPSRNPCAQAKEPLLQPRSKLSRANCIK